MTSPATATATPLELAEQHRVAQNRVAAALAILVVRYFEIFRSPDINPAEAGRTWLAAVLPLVAAGRAASARLAATYWAQQRELHLGDPGVYTLVDELIALNYDQARRSLAYTGVVGFQQRVDRGLPRDRALELAQSEAGGAAQRLALNGGRDVQIDAFAKDPKALGWMRVTRGVDTCYFCAMLASRGPVYKEDSFDRSDPRFQGGIGEVKVHDSCGCFMVPMYSRSDPMPGSNLRFDKIWRESTGGKSGKDAINAFRKALGTG